MPLLGSFVFFWVAPGVVAGWIPYALTDWRPQPPLLGSSAERVVGGVLTTVGVVMLVECFVRFAIMGRGTPAPIAPTETLVASGLYRHVRNPMYVAVLMVITGQALLFGSGLLLRYAVLVWLIFHGFVLLYEEPTLRHRFGSSYQSYRANVPRWLPRITPWRGPITSSERIPSDQGRKLRIEAGCDGGKARQLSTLQTLDPNWSP